MYVTMLDILSLCFTSSDTSWHHTVYCDENEKAHYSVRLRTGPKGNSIYSIKNLVSTVSYDQGWLGGLNQGIFKTQVCGWLTGKWKAKWPNVAAPETERAEPVLMQPTYWIGHRCAWATAQLLSKIQSTTWKNLNKKTQKHDSYFRRNVAWGYNCVALKAQQRASISNDDLNCVLLFHWIAPELFSECIIGLERLSDLFKQCCNTVEIIEWRTNRADADVHDSVYLWRVCGQIWGDNTQSHFLISSLSQLGKCNDTLPSTAHFSSFPSGFLHCCLCFLSISIEVLKFNGLPVAKDELCI